MTSGHFGFAAVVKSSAPKVPLGHSCSARTSWTSCSSSSLRQGLNSFAPLDPSHPAYGQVAIHAYYSHSLVGAILIALVAGFLASWAWGRRAGLVIGAVTFSHWILDLIVHRPDLPILPGNAGNLPLLGFGLWQLPIASMILELILALAGAYLYYRKARNAPAGDGRRHMRALLASGVTGLLLVLLLAADILNLSIFIAILLILLLIILSGWLDLRLHWSTASAS